MSYREIFDSMRLLLILVVLGLGFQNGGCGYGFQNSSNPLYLKEGIQKIYIPPLINNTYKAGVENTVFNSLIRTFVSHKKVVIVKNPEDADAVLQGTILKAFYIQSAGQGVTSLYPTNVGGLLPSSMSSLVVSQEYTANLQCSFTLIRRKQLPGKRGIVWTSTLVRIKPFPAANQLDVPGTTSPLINESEFDRALVDLSRSMMDDVHESMLSMF